MRTIKLTNFQSIILNKIIDSVDNTIEQNYEDGGGYIGNSNNYILTMSDLEYKEFDRLKKKL